MAAAKTPLSLPTHDLIRGAVALFDKENFVAEQALTELFALFPQNDNLPRILLKVVALNRLYSTQIFAVMDMAQHIHQNRQAIDGGLVSGDPKVVDLISKVTIQGKQHNFFSFASKYCSWHAPHLFPLYDSRVDWYLRNLQKQVRFDSSFTKNEFANYSEFRAMMVSLQKAFSLESFTFKEIDKFLWLYGTKANAMTHPPKPSAIEP